MFGAGAEAVFADAQVRHLDFGDPDVVIGFQFLGLAQTRQSRQALQIISKFVGEFYRQQNGDRRQRRNTWRQGTPSHTPS